MWLSTASVDSLTRPRLAVALVSVVAAASFGYYTYQSQYATLPESPTGSGLHRSNAIRRRRPRRNDTSSSSSSGVAGDENVDVNMLGIQNDGETVADDGVDEWWNDPGGFPSTQRTGHNIVNLLFRVSEDNARRNGCVHRGCQCNSCGIIPIRGIRYRCANCADFDLCETCEAQGVHIKTHIFYKIRIPAPPFGARQMQPVWYTGDPDTCRRTLPRPAIAKLSRDTGFERPELEAFWEQWTFMANTEWREDPDDLGVAMDRKTFERCLVPTGGSRHAAPNLIHDRMFSFYDTNKDGLIGFAEFLHGLSYRKRKDKLRKVFEGYDIDADGYVDRRDFLRMFRAYYVLYKQMHKDILAGLEDQLLSSTEAQQLVASRQPLSSLFGREGGIPGADRQMHFEGKTYHPDGNVDVADGFEHVVTDDRPDTASREEILTSLFAYENSSIYHPIPPLRTHDSEQAYWVTLLDPPTRLEELPDILSGNRTLELDTEQDGDDEEDEDEEAEDTSIDEADEDDESHAYGRQPGHIPTDSELRAEFIARNRLEAPKRDKKRRDMARAQLLERWRRRQFYLDEEEGGSAPQGWDNDGDILANIINQTEQMAAGSSKAANQVPNHYHSQPSSKPGLAEEDEGIEVRSNPSTNSMSIPERLKGWRLPEAERDAGTEILYQVTQQAFNELLDSIFKPAEDLAIRAAETKHKREKYKDLVDAVELNEESNEKPRPQEPKSSTALEKPIAEKSLEELLSEAGYSLAEKEAIATQETNGVADAEIGASGETDEGPRADAEQSEYRDVTLPQFRPNQDSAGVSTDDFGPSYPLTNGLSSKARGKLVENNVKSSEPEPTTEELQEWKRLSLAEAKASTRGGWGRLDYHEFAEIYMNQEDQGNRLDYLGSWIDFCIR
ncbi:Protein ref(2)P [Paramyrothecium foliicola]|nr:Protein ref(2)P [Paramyrothecium foliicola]